mmetsp:Transcript_8912/g.25678  ORF Transcript_8912/g.25678 Transcript_8912/m.25678 type:complete len:214 (+) Transcript_8912:376-1017(+)
MAAKTSPPRAYGRGPTLAGLGEMSPSGVPWAETLRLWVRASTMPWAAAENAASPGGAGFPWVSDVLEAADRPAAGGMSSAVAVGGLGVVVGAGVGIGVVLGDMGEALGMGVGVDEGSSISEAVGEGVGAAVGASEGDGVGARVGASVGDGVGAGVGAPVGDGVGAGVGACVGADVSSPVQNCPPGQEAQLEGLRLHQESGFPPEGFGQPLKLQ